ncbi:MAG: CPBP family intramembrane metalloprotease [Ferruginibacter sp.]
MEIFKERYLWAGFSLYVLCICYLHFTFQISLTDFLPAFMILGIGFSFIAWWFTKAFPNPQHRPLINYEALAIAALIAWIVLYITYGSGFINTFFPGKWLENGQIATAIIFIKKLFVFVLIPFAVYKAAGFTLKDFGLRDTAVKCFDKKALAVFAILSVAILLFQYFLANGGKQLRKEHFSFMQVIIAAPLCFLYLFFDAGLIEEFFFRGLLQSRMGVLLKSKTGGIIVSALIFGLVHAPGLYLRGAESEGMEEQMPFLFWTAYTVAYMSIAGIFLGVVYSKTKNLWLVMAIHAMVDLIPNLKEFIHTWHL